VYTHKVYSRFSTWMIQIPRLYNIHKATTPDFSSFQDMLDNIFVPLFEVTRDPSSNPRLAAFLSIVVAFDSVDDESKLERKLTSSSPIPEPKQWKNNENPPYSYYTYYYYTNLFILNKFREAKGLNTFQYRPHCGEAGDLEHLAVAFLTSHGIAHGLNLRRSPVLQYMWYLTQIGIYMSPLSNNALFLDYHKNPCPTFFARGLNVSLSTDDPLQFHFTKEALMEEYSIAAQVWKFSNTDLCELSRNSVLQSGFSHEDKVHWLGDYYWIKGDQCNDIEKTNIPSKLAFFFPSPLFPV
jgi:AMP deaminase